MPTYTENLIIIRNQVAQTLADITANPKPSYTLTDETYSWTEYQDMLFRQLEKLDGLIAQSQPYEIRTRRIVRY